MKNEEIRNMQSILEKERENFEKEKLDLSANFEKQISGKIYTHNGFILLIIC